MTDRKTLRPKHGLDGIVACFAVAVVATACGKPSSGPSISDSASASALITSATGSAHSVATTPPPSEERVWSFDEDESGKPPGGLDPFLVEGPPVNWQVGGHQFGHSAPHVLSIADANAADARVVGLVAGPPRRDVHVSVYCTLEAIRGDTMERKPNPFSVCGLVARYADPKNYYVASANAHDAEVALAVVEGGKRKGLGAWKTGEISEGWHHLELEVVGEGLAVSWEGKRVVEAQDRTFAHAGRAGLTTHVNSRTDFDDFSIAPR